MNSLLKKYLKYFGIFVGVVFIFLIVISVVISVFFKRQLQDYVINTVNKSINTKIEIKDTDISFFKTFPYVSISFTEVKAFSSKLFISKTGRSDTLLSAKEVFFEFNLIKVFQHQYVLKRIQINSGIINLLDINGSVNYEIFNSSDTSGLKTNIDLNLVKLKNCNIIYYNLNNKVLVDLSTDKLLIKGLISDSFSQFSINDNLFIKSLKIDGKAILNNKACQSDLKFTLENKSIKFNDSRIGISGVNFYFNGYYLFGNKPFVDINLKSDNVVLDKFVNLLPTKITHYINDYSFNGKLSFILSVKGAILTNSLPHVDLKFSLLNGVVCRVKSDIKLSDLNFSGFYSNGNNCSLSSSRITIQNFSTSFNTGFIKLSGFVSDLCQPTVDIKANCNLNLCNLKEFLKLDTFDILSGNIKSEIAIFGALPEVSKIKLENLRDLNLKGNCTFQDVSFKIKHNYLDLNSINGLLNIDKDLKFNNLSFFIHKDKILLDGQMVNGLSYLLHKTSDATLEAQLSSNSIDLSNYFVKGDSTGGKSYSREFLFPENVLLKLDLNINYFKLNRFEAKWIKGKLNYKPGMFILNSLSFELCDGRVSGNGAILQDNNNNFLVKGQTEISKIDIHKLFYTFNNFSQDILLEQNLKGKISGKINFSSIWNKLLYLDTKQLLIDGDITLFNGELIQFKPMYNLSKFIALDELQQIKFSTLHNNILVKDEKILIPQMDIKSSAFNIIASGEHSFDNHYKYKVRVLLSDILYSKAKKAKRENEDFGVVEDDGLGKTTIPLTIEGFGKDYKISYDPKSSVQVIKESFSKQKAELKQIFKEEFGWFKHDSTSNSSTNTKKSPKVMWDEDSSETNSNKAGKTKTNKKSESSDKVKVEWE